MSDNPRDTVLRQQIDENLRRVYQEKVEEGIPSHLMDLLNKLKEQDVTDAPVTQDGSSR